MSASGRRWSVRTWVFVFLGVITISVAIVGAYFWQRDADYYDPDLAAQAQAAKLAPATLPGATMAGWPQWLGPNRDGVSPEKGFRTDWPRGDPGPLRAWEKPIG